MKSTLPIFLFHVVFAHVHRVPSWICRRRPWSCPIRHVRFFRRCLSPSTTTTPSNHVRNATECPPRSARHFSINISEWKRCRSRCVSIFTVGAFMDAKWIGKECDLSPIRLLFSLLTGQCNTHSQTNRKRGLYIIDLENPYDPPRVIHHMSSWEVSDVQWNPHRSREHWIATTVGPRSAVYRSRYRNIISYQGTRIAVKSESISLESPTHRRFLVQAHPVYVGNPSARSL